MDKQEQKRLITEIMETDAKDGLYEPTISKMETTQTAVEWLLKNLKDKLSIEQANAVISQAKAMEKEQIIQFADRYVDDVMGGCNLRAEQYYNKTYNKR